MYPRNWKSHSTFQQCSLSLLVLPLPFAIRLFFSWCFVGSFVCYYYIYFNSINIYNNDDGMWQKFFIISLIFFYFLPSWYREDASSLFFLAKENFSFVFSLWMKNNVNKKLFKKQLLKELEMEGEGKCVKREK